jgi:hypothetical protein
MKKSIGVKRKRNFSPEGKNTLLYIAMHVIEKVKAGRYSHGVILQIGTLQ